MSVCLLAGGKAVALAITAFTLAWSHSVEKTAWEEDWRLMPGGLQLVEARVQGSGAGMEPPAHARFDGVWWRYAPAVAVIPELVLAGSGRAGVWRLCVGGQCRDLPEDGTGPIVLRPCAGSP